MRRENIDVVADRFIAVCGVTAHWALLSELHRFFAASGLAAAITRRDTPMLFDWPARVFSFQGVSDTIAAAYLDQHGTIGFEDIAAPLAAGPSCPPARELLPLPQLPLRQGRLQLRRAGPPPRPPAAHACG